ncbi:uncharacterized protein [Dermacentor albipictus]|uniref:uncharacterized protein isoform X6 n=1 Tax=Dermacentor albipictus TaxID=60249 RepID=UPI0038FC2D78
MTEMSEMSSIGGDGLSGIESSAMSESGITVEDAAEGDIFGGGGGSGGGGGGGSSGPSAGDRTTATSDVSVNELVCTVGAYALYPSMIPTDGLCHYVYYSDVIMARDTLHGDLVPESWATFQSEMGTRSRTSGGIGFDIRYSTAAGVSAGIEKQLRELANKNIKHYGVLNLLQKAAKMKNMYSKAKELLKKLKGVQGNDATRKTLLAFGIYNYREKDAYTILQDIFTDAINNHVADTVIIYSSVGWIETEGVCYSHPTSVFDKSDFKGSSADKEADRAPYISKIAQFMRRTVRYTSDTKMGLSFELGTLVYTLKKPYSGNIVTDDMVNAECTVLVVTSLDVAPCKSDLQQRRVELFRHVNVAQVKGDKKKAMFFESEDTLRLKCLKLARNATLLRADMSLLLVNAHLGDPTKSCPGRDGRERGEIFWRIEVVKATLNIT